MTTQVWSRWVLRLFKGVAVCTIWLIWLDCGLRGAWAIHHRFMWRSTGLEYVQEITFVPVPDPQGRLSLSSFRDLALTGAAPKVFQPAASFQAGSREFTHLVQAFNEAHKLHFGTVGRAVLINLGSRPEGTRYEMAVYYWGGGELRWRFIADRSAPRLLEWYEIHDTAGLAMLPIAVLVWLVSLPLAIWTTRRTMRFRTAANT